MKKVFRAILALLLCGALLAGCSDRPAPAPTDAPATGAVQDPTADPAGQPSESEAAESDPAGQPSESEAAAPQEPFDMEAFLRQITTDHPGAGAMDLCGAILESPYFALFQMESTEYYYPGLNYEYHPEGIAEICCAVDYMSGSGALVYAIVPSAETDAQALADELKANADLNWMWSETPPDQLVSTVLDGRVFLAMYRSDMQPITGPLAAKARDFVEMFHSYCAENPAASCADMASWFLTHQKITSMYAAPVEEGRLTGFGDFEHETTVTGFKDGAIFSPQMSPSSFIGYVFELEEGADVTAFEQMLREKANPAWNVCVVVNTIITETDGSRVLFMMCNE